MSEQSFISAITDNVSDSILFCMPGHNGKLSLPISLDITELNFSDNLQNPNGIIKNLEDKIARIYHADNTLIFTSGATSAIAAALATAKQFGSVVAVDERAHKSVYSYAKLLGMSIVKFDSLHQNIENLGAVLITSPDYFGNVYDCAKYKQAALKYNVPLIADQSHGSHFVFSNLLPNGLETIADIIINSLHKTLPVLTGGAIANVTKQYANIMRYNRAMLHTTSPSYLVMSSIEKAIDDFFCSGEKYYQDILKSIEKFKLGLSYRYSVVANDDFSRLVISVKKASSSAIINLLADKKIFIEMSYQDKIVLIVTPFNHFHLPKVMNELNNFTYKENTVNSDFCSVESYQTNQKSAVNALNSIDCDKVEFVKIEDAASRISASDIGIYPPGIPIIVSGDVIDANIIKLIIDNKNNCFGLVGECIACTRR